MTYLWIEGLNPRSGGPTPPGSPAAMVQGAESHKQPLMNLRGPRAQNKAAVLQSCWRKKQKRGALKGTRGCGGMESIQLTSNSKDEDRMGGHSSQLSNELESQTIKCKITEKQKSRGR